MTLYSIIVEAPISIPVTDATIKIVAYPRTRDAYRLTIKKISEVAPAPGPREISDPEYDVSRLGPNGSARREAKIETDTFGGPRPKPHENVTERLDSLERHIKGHVVSLNALNQRISKSDEEASLNLVATDTRLDRLSGIINEQDQRLGKLENLPGLATLNAAVVKLEDRLENHAVRLRNIQDRVTQAEVELGDRATVSVDLRQVHNRLNRIASRLGMLPTNEEINGYCGKAGKP